MAALTIQDNNLNQGENLIFGITGFNPNELVYFYIYPGILYGEVSGVNPIYSSSNYCNASGDGTWYIGPINDVPGTYTLRVRNSLYVTPHYDLFKQYTVASGTIYSPTISVSPSSIVQGSTINVVYAGFPGNTLVTLTVVQTGGYWTLSTIASGSGTWSGLGPINDAPGTYTLRAVDSAGHTATTSFTITAVAAWVAITTVSATVISTTSVSWVEITKVEGIVIGVTSTSWVELIKIEAIIAGETASTWVEITKVETMIAAATWAVLNSIEAAVMVADAYSWMVVTTVAVDVKPPSGSGGGTGGGLSTGAAVAIGLSVVGLGVAAAMSQPKVREKVTSTAKKATAKAKALLKG